MGTYENIRQKIRQLKTSLDENPEVHFRVDLLNSLSKELYVYDADEALLICLRARQLAKEIDYSRGIAESYNNEAYVYRIRGDFLRSLNLSRQALQYFESIADKRGCAASRNNIAFMQVNLDDIHDGLEQALKAWMLSQEEKDPEAESFALLVMGMCYENLGDYPQAIEHHMHAQSICRDLNLLNEEGAATLNLGIVFRKIGEHLKARDQFNKALKIFRQMHIRLLEAAALLHLGYSFLDSEDLQRALECFQQSLEIQNELRHMRGQGACYINIGRIYQKLGQFKKAEDHINHSLEQARIFNKKNNEANAKYYLADCYLEQRKTSEAITLLEESLEDAELHASKEVRYKMLVTLSRAYESKNDFKKALLYFRNAQHIHEELINEESSKKNKGLMILNEVENVRRERDFAIREKERAEQSEKFKEQFLANISHEIRTPMNAIVGLADLLSRTRLNNIQNKYVDTIQQSADSLLEIIQEVLDFSKIEAGEVQLESIRFNVRDVTQSVFNALQFKAVQKNIELNIECAGSVPEYVTGDALKLKQVLFNLIGNAIKFTLQGSVNVFCNLLDEDAEEVQLRFDVSDTGIGIAQNKLHDIFKSFVQASSSTTRNYGGTGLGLTISQHLIEMQGGKIFVESKENSGTTFSFFIRYKTALAEEGPVENAELPFESSALKGLHVLLVEDNSFNQLVAADTLKEYIPGIGVTIAENGTVALKELASKKFDLVLLDLQMPVMDGYETVQHIRSHPNEAIKKLAVIALTANATKAEREHCLNAGMNGYLSKPFQPEDLIGTIERVLSKAAVS